MAERALFLDRIRREMGKTAGLFTAATAERPAHPEAAADAVRRQMAERWREALDRFKDIQQSGVSFARPSLAECQG
jgi:hypothetical protein